MVTTAVVVSGLVLSPTGTQQTVAETAIGAMLIAANFAIASTTGGYFDAPAHTNPLLNTWSLSVEEQFYLAFPLLLAFSWLLARRTTVIRHIPFLIVGLVAAASFGLAVLGSSGYLPPRSSWLLGFYSPLTRAWEFSAGALLALAGSRVHIASRGIASTLGFTGIAALCASLSLISDKTPFPGTWTLLPVMGTVLLILAGYRDSNPVSRGLATRPMVKIGDWSYSIYLWHWPLIAFAGIMWPGSPRLTLLAVAVSLGLALASYYWVEQPIRETAGWSKAYFARLVVATIAIPSVLGVGLGVAARSWFWNDSLRLYMTAIQSNPTGWSDPLCVSRIPVNERDVRPCQWNSAAPGKPVYLIGDSNAMHFSEALKEAGTTLQRPVTALGSDGCPLIDVYIQRGTDLSLLGQCRDDYIALMNWLRKQPPGTVMIASVDRYWRDPDYLVSLDAKFTEADPHRNSQALNAGLTKTVTELQAAGHSVILVQTIPHFIARPYMIGGVTCSGWNVLMGACRRPLVTMPVEFADEWQSASRQGIRKVADDTAARIFDLRHFFCPNGICSTRHINGTDLYLLDGYHLNRLGSALLEEEFLKELQTTD